MKIPFGVEEFLAVFTAYNNAIWPAQVIAYLLGAAAVALVFRPGRASGRVISAILAVFWLWNGIFYHIGHFSRINPVAVGFGAVFILQGLLFAYYGVVAGKLRYAFRPGPGPLAGVCLIAYAVVVYPLLGYSFGHVYPASPVFGVAPCPTTIFTFGILLLAVEPLPLALAVVPLLWSVVGLSAAVSLRITEDYGLSVAGVLGLAFILAWRKGKVMELEADSRG